MPHLGMGSHQSARMGKDEWITPVHIVSSLGHFHLDPCAPINPPWPLADTTYTIEDDGLNQPWFGRVWLNPPYGLESAAWLEKMVEHGVGTALIFARTETDMFFRYVWDCAGAILFLRGRLYFHHINGDRASFNAGAPSCLIAYGDGDVEALRRCDIPGKLVIL
jgi:hypothetical protein